MSLLVWTVPWSRVKDAPPAKKSLFLNEEMSGDADTVIVKTHHTDSKIASDPLSPTIDTQVFPPLAASSTSFTDTNTKSETSIFDDSDLFKIEKKPTATPASQNPTPMNNKASLFDDDDDFLKPKQVTSSASKTASSLFDDDDSFLISKKVDASKKEVKKKSIFDDDYEDDPLFGNNKKSSTKKKSLFDD